MAGPAQSGVLSPLPRAPVDTPDLRRILGMELPVTVELAQRDMAIESILAIGVGTIIEFSASFDSEHILRVADRPIGRGFAVKIGENFGLRITSIAPVEDRIESLGGGA